MRASRAPQSTVRVSLFPFLAVLICTMGALILLLVVIARQARLDATQPSMAEVENEDLDIQRELLTLQIEQLAGQRQATQDDLERQRLELGHVEDHARRLQEELRELEAAHRALELAEKAGGEDTEKLHKRLEYTKKLIREVEEQLDEVRSRLADQPRRYAVVAYDGKHQTNRIPIYIECRGDAIILQPEGVLLTEDDFQGPLDLANPLAAAVRAAREYLARTAGPDAIVAGEPYPLLLVRPDGIMAYYVARSALKSWASDFGYELIDRDWELEFPPPDPELAQIERQAIAEARLKQEQLAALAPRRYGNMDRPVYRAAPGGGVVRVDGGNSGFGGRGSRRSFSADELTEPRHTGRGQYGGGERPRGLGNATDPEALADVYGNLDGEPFGGSIGGGSASGRSGGEHDRTAGNRPPALAGSGASHFDPEGEQRGEFGAGGGHGGTAGRDTGNGGSGGDSSGSTADGRVAQGSDSRQAATSPQRPGGSPSDGSRSQATSGSPGGTAASGAAHGASGAQAATGAAPGSTSGSSGGNDDQPPPEWDAADQPVSVQVQKLAKHRGADWALPGSTRGAVPITRPIRLRVHEDRVILWTDDRPPAPYRTIPLAQRTEDSVDELVSGLWRHMESWGIAGNGLYWRPVLNIEVPPDGNQRFDQLAVLLDDSGFEIRKRVIQPHVAERINPLVPR